VSEHRINNAIHMYFRISINYIRSLEVIDSYLTFLKYQISLEGALRPAVVTSIQTVRSPNKSKVLN
jgi:hypothetical protein